MYKKFILTILSVIFLTAPGITQKARAKHTFALGTSEFLLDGNPFQIISGEMHPSRIPAEYWRHRFREAGLLGLKSRALRKSAPERGMRR